MQSHAIFWGRCLLAIWPSLAVDLGFGAGRKTQPTASLPIEPAAADSDVFDAQNAEAVTLDRSTSAAPKARQSEIGKGQTLGMQAGLQMTYDGFGAKLRFLEPESTWLAFSQTLRYQSQERPEALFEKQYGLMLGLEIHPWRQARIAPLVSLQAGGDRYLRGIKQDELDLFGLEASFGLEMKLMRAASFLFQWTEVYYPGLRERLLLGQKPKAQYAGSFQVFFNLRWDASL